MKGKEGGERGIGREGRGNGEKGWKREAGKWEMGVDPTKFGKKSKPLLSTHSLWTINYMRVDCTETWDFFFVLCGRAANQ